MIVYVDDVNTYRHRCWGNYGTKSFSPWPVQNQISREIALFHEIGSVLQRWWSPHFIEKVHCRFVKRVWQSVHYCLFSSWMYYQVEGRRGLMLPDSTHYRKLVGKLNSLTNIRLNISYSVQHLSQFMQTPKEPHPKAALHVLRCLKNDPTMGIFFSSNPDCTMKALCDSDWVACPNSRRSVSGYIVLLGDSPIIWKSKKQKTVSIFSAEA